MGVDIMRKILILILSILFMISANILTKKVINNYIKLPKTKSQATDYQLLAILQISKSCPK